MFLINISYRLMSYLFEKHYDFCKKIFTKDPGFLAIISWMHNLHLFPDLPKGSISKYIVSFIVLDAFRAFSH